MVMTDDKHIKGLEVTSQAKSDDAATYLRCTGTKNMKYPFFNCSNI